MVCCCSTTLLKSLYFWPCVPWRAGSGWGARVTVGGAHGGLRSLDITVEYCQCEYMGITKDDRLQLRVDEVSKRRLADAASETHLSVSAFVLQYALRAADDVLAERQAIRLEPAAAAAFTEALSSPARVNERLAQALQRSAKFTWLD